MNSETVISAHTMGYIQDGRRLLTAGSVLGSHARDKLLDAQFDDKSSRRASDLVAPQFVDVAGDQGLSTLCRTEALLYD